MEGSFDTGTGAPTLETSIVRSGNYSMKITGMTSTVRMRRNPDLTSSDNGGPFYSRGYLRLETLPTAANAIMTFGTNTGVRMAWISVDDTGALILNDEDGVIGSASSALSLNTWYRL